MKLLLCLIALTSLFADPGHLYYLMQRGEVSRAVSEYRETMPEHDFSVLRQMASLLLQSAAYSKEGETQMLAMFGAGVAQDSSVLPVFRAGLQSNYPEVQAAAINLMMQLNHDDSVQMLKSTLSSPFVLIRLEALYQLAKTHDPETCGHLESLMCKIPEETYPLFPQLFAMINTPDSDRAMRRFLHERDGNLRRAAVVSLTRAGRDDFLPEIRTLAAQLDPLQQEVCAFAIGEMQDSSSEGRLDQLSYSATPSVRVAALQALYKLGRKGARFHLEALARGGDPFAIYALGEMEGSETALILLSKSRDLTLRVNAAAALLTRRHPAAAKPLRDLFIRDNRDYGYIVQFSPGGALPAIRPIASIHGHKEEHLPEVSQHLRETLLVQTLELPDAEFLSLASEIFNAQQNDLIPTLVTLLEAKGSDEAFNLLEKQTTRLDAPLIRHYCNLALFRSGREGPWADNLAEWLSHEHHNALFQLRPLLTFDQRQGDYALTTEETSRLLIESYEALGQRHDQKAVDAILHALEHGNPQNWYPLAGLLFRVTE